MRWLNETFRLTFFSKFTTGLSVWISACKCCCCFGCCCTTFFALDLDRGGFGSVFIRRMQSIQIKDISQSKNGCVQKFRQTLRLICCSHSSFEINEPIVGRVRFFEQKQNYTVVEMKAFNLFLNQFFLTLVIHSSSLSILEYFKFFRWFSPTV